MTEWQPIESAPKETPCELKCADGLGSYFVPGPHTYDGADWWTKNGVRVKARVIAWRLPPDPPEPQP